MTDASTRKDLDTAMEFHRTGDWILNPGKITVYLHDTIETKGMSKEQAEELRYRVHAIVEAPVEEHIARGNNS